MNISKRMYGGKVLKISPPSARLVAAYNRAKAAQKLAYRQGRAKQPLSGDALKFFEHGEKDAHLYQLTGNIFRTAYQNGMLGVRADGSQPKRKLS